MPLGNRRRFGPAPTEDAPAPQLAQPSPSAYPRPRDQDESSKRGRDDSPANGDSKGKSMRPKLPDICNFAALYGGFLPIIEVVCKLSLHLDQA